MKTGTSDGPSDVDRSTEHRGSSAGTPGLNALDEEREASLADEGGAAGALIESQDLDTLRRLGSDLPAARGRSAEPRRRPNLWLAGALAAAALGLLALRKRR